MFAMDNKEEYYKRFFRKTVTHNRPISEYIKYLGLSHKDIQDMNGKDIVLIGGGESNILADLENGGIASEDNWRWSQPETRTFEAVKPRSVTNIDPFARALKNGEQDLIKEDFTDFYITPDFADNMLALFSLPHYCKSVEQVKMFYAKACLGLAPRGKLNVFPITPRSHRGEIELQWVDAFGEFVTKLQIAEPKVDVTDESLLDDTAVPCFTMPDDKTKVNKFVLDYMRTIDMGNAKEVNVF